MAFGTTPISTTSLGANQFPVSAVASPDTLSGNLTALQGAPGAYLDGNLNQMTAAILNFGTPLVVQKAHNVTGSGAKTLTCAFTFSNIGGNSIMVAVGLGEVEIGGGSPITLAITDTNNNTYKQAGSPASQSTTLEATIFYATSVAGGANAVTVTIAGAGSSNTAIAVEIYEVYGLIAFAGALDSTAMGSSAGSTAVSTGATTPVLPNELNVVAIAAAGGTITAGTNWTLDSGTLAPSGGNLVSFGSMSRLHSQLTSLTPSATLGSSNAWAACVATFKPVAVPVEGTVRSLPQAASSGGATPYHLISAASTNATNVKASPGNLYGYTLSNTSSSYRYVKFSDNASTPSPGSDTVKRCVQVPGNGTVERAFPAGLAFLSGISFFTTGAMADADTSTIGAGDLSIDFEYA